MYVYVLRLRQGKFYVGKTSNVRVRFCSHVEGSGSVWTRMYEPVDVHEVKPLLSEFDEDNTTKEYMRRYGINNVRGGSYCSVVLDNNARSALERELRGTSGRCFTCGSTSHWARECPQLVDSESDSDSSVEYRCYRCGRTGHWANGCYARTNKRGQRLY